MMRIYSMPGALAAALLLSLATPVAAPPEPGPPPAGEPGEEASAEPVDQELAEAIQDVMVIQAKRRLGLSEEQARDVGALMRRMGEARRDHQARRRDGLRTLAAMAEDSSMEEAEIKRRIDAVLRADEEFMSTERRLMGDIRAKLDTRQQARWIVFNDRFRDEMRRRVEDARGGRRGAPGMRRPLERPGAGPPAPPPPEGGERAR